jgi:adenosylcobinamide amidohydrolase
MNSAVLNGGLICADHLVNMRVQKGRFGKDSSAKKDVTIQVSQIQIEKDLFLGVCGANMRGRSRTKATGKYSRRFVE